MNKQHVKIKGRVKIVRLAPLLLIMLLLVAMPGLTGCRTAYLWQAVTGQAGVEKVSSL
ncbi:MAG: hypothetical protein HQK60_02100 [Deltaproteobacteria bacterium]|nr:hypothetical protein [Deltaproteobacteria bacterium]